MATPWEVGNARVTMFRSDDGTKSYMHVVLSTAGYLLLKKEIEESGALLANSTPEQMKYVSFVMQVTAGEEFPKE